MTAVAAVSHHPVAADAAGEVLGTALEHIGSRPDFVLVAAAGAHRQFLTEIAQLVSSVLAPARSLCLGAPLVVGGPNDADAIGVLAASDGVGLVDVDRVPFPTVGLTDVQGALIDGVPTESDRSTIGFGPAQTVTTVPTTRAVGPELVVTDIDGPYLKELASRPALARLEDVAGALDPVTRRLFGRHVVLAETDGDASLHHVRGADKTRGVLALDRPLVVGSVVRFRVRDPAWTATVLRTRLDGAAGAALLVGDLRAGDEQTAHDRGPVSVAASALGGAALGIGGVVPLIGPATGVGLPSGHIAVATFGPESRATSAD